MNKKNDTKKVRISDCTLRDVAHAPFVTLGQAEALKIARAVDRLGIDEIEAGIPLASVDDTNLVQKLVATNLNAKLVTFYINRRISKLEDDLKRVRDLGVDGVAISTPISKEHARLKLTSSSPSFIIKLMSKAVSIAKSLGLYVCFTGEDAARTDLKFLKEYAKAGEEAGADRFRFAESVSNLLPNQMETIIGEIKSDVSIDVECHCHNMYGLAVANSIAAYRAGATWLSGTINGHGERGGNASLNEILLILQELYGMNQYDLQYLFETANFVAQACNLPIPKDRGIVGKYAFAYELGNQVAYPSFYEPFGPKTVGNQRYTIIGKKADLFGIRKAVAETHIQIDDEGLKELRFRFINWYREKKEYFESTEFIHKFLNQRKEGVYANSNNL